VLLDGGEQIRLAQAKLVEPGGVVDGDGQTPLDERTRAGAARHLGAHRRFPGPVHLNFGEPLDEQRYGLGQKVADRPGNP
jgi:hypothetical protein